jgi:hypothetical protein
MPREVGRRESHRCFSPLAGGSGAVIKLGELVMILDLHRQGPTVSAIARQLGIDRKTVRRYLERGLEPPTYGPGLVGPGGPIPSYHIYASGLPRIRVSLRIPVKADRPSI